MSPPARLSRRRASLLATALLAAALLGGCASQAVSPEAARRAATPIDTVATPVATPTAAPTPAPTPVPLAVAARPFHEPGDYAHRNYCGAGASEVLLSAWMPATPPLEEVATRAGLDPRSGQTGANTAAELNSYLDPIVVPRLGRSWYRADHVTSLPAVEDRLSADLGSADALAAFGHTAPVMVQTMTRTMPGWSGWQATHMITVVAADLGHGDPSLDTVTYAETPSPLAGYRGPDFQTVSVAALWVAMEAFITDDPADPVNVIW